LSFAEAERSLTQRDRGTLAWLIHALDASTELARKAESTHKEYRRMFRVIEDAFGDASLAAVEDPRFTGICSTGMTRLPLARRVKLTTGSLSSASFLPGQSGDRRSRPILSPMVLIARTGAIGRRSSGRRRISGDLSPSPLQN
jgi:hypothetical protein